MTDDDFVDDIVRMTKMVQALMDLQLPALDQQINSILAEKRTDIEEIEQILDVLLDYGHLGVGKKEFFRLNNYYATFSPDNAKIYRGFYDQYS